MSLGRSFEKFVYLGRYSGKVCVFGMVFKKESVSLGRFSKPSRCIWDDFQEKCFNLGRSFEKFVYLGRSSEKFVYLGRF